ncbi:tRNA (adenosine(37)-N6)-threonylcarbamoyltransferase complex transferase subunit TsaD [Carboxydothermus pertinax]|uniref:tRNA N6-adenosine threonylcarbamoyltransferase n=1 Tax=Carboxydothermus pertinax TaxID=870242 RepID=A0A1L8CSR0_9THEO|nr:tRNA (adenosine(37)-N6)-threonylcarbamoyltransferase complex transferase subunit TsaD [Carboxydothermus pertinax]GAV21960.1 tRNA (adenosine(37)-N6)-threonylcarbamoyltransferase complex transferase subunit TsaD [Carboxydothermus pertinax]
MGKVILGIETSCDETAVALVEDGKHVLKSLISSQIDLHRKFGGVVPEIASRKHLEVIFPLLEELFSDFPKEKIAAVAVTYGPGLVGALLVGLSVAKSLSYALNIPLIGVNHMEGHIFANFLEDPNPVFPALVLVVSGGHTDLIFMRGFGDYELLGETIDDAAGECFDKVGRVLNLPYPAGPIIDRLSSKGKPLYKFPVARLKEGSYNFSFSGLKTAVRIFCEKNPQARAEDIAASFQEALVKALVEKTVKALKNYQPAKIYLAGGVAANSKLREEFLNLGKAFKVPVHFPSLQYCTDNAAMIAAAGYHRYLLGKYAPLNLNAYPSLMLGEEKY